MAHRTVGLVKVLESAKQISNKFNIHYVSTVELVYAMLISSNCFASEYLNKFGVTKENFYLHLRNALIPNLSEGYTVEASSSIYNAEKIALKFGYNYISSEHLLYSILLIEESRVLNIFNMLGVDVEGLKTFIEQQIIARKVEESSKNQTNISQSKTAEKVDKNENPLQELGYFLTDKAKKGLLDAVIGRETEIERVIQTLARKTKNNPLLIGEPGVGKSAIVEGLALKIINNDVPETLKNKKIFSLDISGLVSGTKYRGEFEKKLKNAINYVLQNKQIILFIDEIHNIVGAGSTADSGLDVAEIFKPLLSRGELPLIGATTIEEYRKYIEKDGALERRFQTIMVNEPTIEQTIEILQGLKSTFENHHKVKISDQAIECAVKLSVRYINDRRLPDKAIDLIDEACSKKKIGFKKQTATQLKLNKEYETAVANRDYSLHHNDLDGAKFYDKQVKVLQRKIEEENAKISRQKEQTENLLTIEDIRILLAEITDIPINYVDEIEALKLNDIEDQLYKMVVGQDKAIEVVSRALKRSLTGLKDPDRPIGVFLFVGPTGVGKSQLAKAINEVAFRNKDGLIRFDMSEYSDKTSVNKLIGTAPGYVGYEEDGLLTEKVRRKPYSVILLDEIEKACPEIFDLLLQVIDEGRLTDSKGRVIDFKNTIIILTSNVGYQTNDKKFVGFGEDNIEISVKENLKNTFRLEFLNRLDDIVVFKNLTKNDCYDVADILVNALIKRIREDGYVLTIENSAMDVIVNNAYKNGGARQIKREIALLIEDLLTDAIIDGSVKIGDKIVVYGQDNDVKYKVL